MVKNRKSEKKRLCQRGGVRRFPGSAGRWEFSSVFQLSTLLTTNLTSGLCHFSPTIFPFHRVSFEPAALYALLFLFFRFGNAYRDFERAKNVAREERGREKWSKGGKTRGIIWKGKKSKKKEVRRGWESIHSLYLISTKSVLISLPGLRVGSQNWEGEERTSFLSRTMIPLGPISYLLYVFSRSLSAKPKVVAGV